MTRSRPARAGYSLLELLVALAIVAVVIGLVLSAVAKVRLRAAQAADQNNLRQVALAAHAYEAQHRQLPPLIDGHRFAQPVAKGEPPTWHLVPVGMTLAPYLEGPPLETLYAGGGIGWLTLVVPAYVSPSDPTHVAGRIDFETNARPFVGVSNVAFNAQLFADPGGGASAPAVRGVTEWSVWQRRGALAAAAPDGTSQTAMLATKRAKCGPRGGSVLSQAMWPGWHPAGASWGDSTPDSATLAAFFGHRLPDASGTGPTFQDRPSDAECASDLAQGFHRGRISVAMADGSVRAVSAGIAPKLWRSGVLPSDGAGLPAE